jgi:tetratricopeptide (TPR) repeat protein
MIAQEEEYHESHLPFSQNADIHKQIESMLRLSSELINKNLDSALLYAEMANHLIENLETDSAKIEVLKNLGDVYLAGRNFEFSLRYYFAAKTLCDDRLQADPENIPFFQKQLDLLIRIGTVFFFQKNFDQALQYYDEAMLYWQKINISSPTPDISSKIRLLNNIAAVHIQRFQFDKALEFYKSALETNTSERNDVIEASLSNNIGICYMELNEFDLANYYFQRALTIREKLGDKRGEAQCYNNIGKNYVYLGNFMEAKKYFLKALDLGRAIGSKESMLISLESLSSIYDTMGEYRKAFESHKEFKSINDSIFNIESMNRIAQLEMQYKANEQEKLFTAELKRREAEQANRELIYFIVGGVLFFLLITAALLIFLQRSKIRNSKLENEKLELEHKHLNLEKQNLETEIKFKNRELATKVLYLLKKNELITNISEKLFKSKLDFKKENQKIIQEILLELKSNQDTDMWAEFEAHFTQVHSDFYKNLNEKFPNLSSNEKKLCAFLRLNLSTKDISAITYQSVNSITVARSRLRKKLNIEGEDMHLINFLMQF